MAQDEMLNLRIRGLLKGKRGIKEKAMFGGLCFMHHGNMLCGVSLQHGLMVRVGPDQYESALKLKHAEEMDFTGRPMKGFISAEPDGFRTQPGLKKWIELGLAFTKTLPRK